MPGKSDFVVCSDSFMTFSAVAPGPLNFAELRLLCTIGSCVGVAVIVLGLRLDRKGRHSSQEHYAESSGPDPVHESSTAESRAPKEVIHLSTNFGPMKSSDMSQQQKIAAALTRAGIANSVGWSIQGSSRTAIAVMEPPPETPTSEDRAPHHTPISAHSSLLSRLMVLSGSMLLLLSLISFLALR
jgi:hypothetical protein